MAKDYSKLLMHLKKLLPKGYQRKIAQSLPSVETWHVKWAFSGRTVKPEALKKIYNKAKRMADKYQAELARASAEFEALKKRSKKSR